MTTTACSTCRTGDGPHDAAAWRPVASVIDEIHFHVTLVRCPTCADMAVRIFTELVDWTDGDDSQASMIVPLPPGPAGPARPSGDSATVEQFATESAVVTRLAALGRCRYLAKVNPKGFPVDAVWSWYLDRPMILPHD